MESQYKLNNFYKGKKILITGAAGTVGKEIVKQLLSCVPAEIRLVDNNETGIFFLMEDYNKNGNIKCFLGDVRDGYRMEKLVKSMEIIVHCAAFKHVILSEYNPFDVVQTNIVGLENIIRVAINCDVKYVLFTSSDKAVNPTNVMGTSKLMGEKLITAANAVKNNESTIFSSTRFGNVIGSRGSVVPIFMKQIRKGGPVTITDNRMTRFVMTVEEAAKFVLKSVTISRGGEVFITKMPVVNITDLADVMIEILAPKYGYKVSDIKKIEIGAKPGEKLYEELMGVEEVHRAFELKDMFVITPAFKAIYQSIRYEYPETISNKIKNPYVSSIEIPLSKKELKQYFIENKILEKVEETFYGGTM